MLETWFGSNLSLSPSSFPLSFLYISGGGRRHATLWERGRVDWRCYEPRRMDWVRGLVDCRRRRRRRRRSEGMINDICSSSPGMSLTRELFGPLSSPLSRHHQLFLVGKSVGLMKQLTPLTLSTCCFWAVLRVTSWTTAVLALTNSWIVWCQSVFSWVVHECIDICKRNSWSRDTVLDCSVLTVSRIWATSESGSLVLARVEMQV